MISIASTLVLFGCIVDMIITIYIASKPASENQKWLLLTCAIASACNMVYFAELKESDLYLKCTFHNLVFMLKGFTGVAFFIFIFSYCEKRMNGILRLCFCLASFIYGSISTFNGKTFWLYTPDTTESGKYGLYLDLDYHVLYYIVVTTYLIAAVICYRMLIKKLVRSEGSEKVKTFCLILTNTSPVLGFFISMLIGRGGNFDALIISFDISLVLLTIIVARLGLSDALQIAMKDLISDSGEGFLVVDNDYKLLYSNEMVNENFGEYIENFNDYKEKIKRLFTVNLSMKSFNGKDYEIRVNDVCEGRARIGHMAWVIDRTYITKNTQQIIKLKQEAEAANIAKSQFLADMSHEIRTPMNAIVGFSDLLINEDDADTIHTYAKDINDSAKILLSLINKILDISKIESGKLEVRISTYNTLDFIATVGNVIGYAAESKGLEYRAHISENVPNYLTGASDVIYEILINLLNNGVKYTQKGYVELNATYENDNLCFVINDTGVGMSPEYLSQIYEKFSRVNSEANKHIEGTGLGMSIVKALVDKLDGEISVESEPGKGTSFKVCIPQAVADESAMKSVEAHNPLDDRNFVMPSARILVVDDNELNLKVISSIFKTYKNEISVASSGRESLDLMADNEYDIVFMDQMMPEMDGVTAMLEARKIPYYQNRPIILLTANAIRGVEDEMLKVGFDGYLTKPIDKLKLNNMLLDKLPPELIIFQDTKLISDDDIFDSSDNLANQILDIRYGIHSCGESESDYKDILSFICESYEEHKNNLMFLYEAEDWEHYTINVHGLKSSTRSVGAAALSNLAAELEQAGKENRLDFIHANHEKLLGYYRDMVAEAEQYLSSDNNESICKEDLENIISNISNMINAFDLNGADTVVMELLEFSLEDETRIALEELDAKLKAFDYEESIKIIDSLM